MTFLNKSLKLIYALRGEAVGSALKELLLLEKADPQFLKQYKENKINELTDFASKNCGYYIEFFKNLQPEIKSDSPSTILKQLPVMDKFTISNNPTGFISGQIRASQRSTSGTTGAPFIFQKDKHASAYMDAMMYRAYHWHGINPMDRQARLWGRKLKFWGHLIQNGKDLVLNRRRLSSFTMDDGNCRKFYDSLLTFRPKYFYCYPNAIYQFALSLEKQGLDGRKIGASVAICTGEVLFPHHRTKIEQVLGCKVVNEYGSTENGIIGFECEYGGFHLMPTVHLDILNPDSDGFGEIAITELNSRSVPFIKYKNGDVGRMIDSGCPCRRPFEVFEIREGRIDDFIICPNGSIVYDAILAYTLKDYALQFKAFQEKADLLNILIVPGRNYKGSSEKSIQSKLKNYLGPEMVINCILVESIPPDNSGKLRYFISRLKLKAAR